MKSTPVTALLIAAGFASVAADGLAAVPLRPLREPSLFVSPCGRPYRAKAGEPYPVAVWFAEADANKDGKLDRAELRADAAAFFTVLDQDKNGIIEGMEISFYENRILPEMVQNQEFSARSAPGLLVRAQYNGGPDDPPMVQGDDSAIQHQGPTKNKVNLQGAAPYNFLREPEPLTASDGDFNHRITKDEFAAASDRRFKLLDKDGDGALTLDTLPMTAIQAAMGGGGGRPRR